jgi:hypothetical protein
MLRQPLKARVCNGRLVLDEPTDLPDGEEIYLVPLEDEGDELDDEERAALHRSLARGIAELDRGEGVDAEVFLAELRARRQT